MFTVSVVTRGFVKQALKTLFCADLLFSVLHKARHIFDVNGSMTNKKEVPDYLMRSVKWCNHQLKKNKIFGCNLFPWSNLDIL